MVFLVLLAMMCHILCPTPFYPHFKVGEYYALHSYFRKMALFVIPPGNTFASVRNFEMGGKRGGPRLATAVPCKWHRSLRLTKRWLF